MTSIGARGPLVGLELRSMQPLEEAELSGRTALVIADEDALSRTICMALEERGAQASTSQSWPADVEKRVDLLVLVDRRGEGPTLGSLDDVRESMEPVLRGMRQRSWGRVVMVSPSTEASSHRRAGLFGLLRSVALEVSGEGVTVNAIDLGLMDSEVGDEQTRAKLLSRTPSGRAVSLLEVSRGVCFLASPAAAYITGAVLPLNGGLGLGLYPEQFNSS